MIRQLARLSTRLFSRVSAPTKGVLIGTLVLCAWQVQARPAGFNAFLSELDQDLTIQRVLLGPVSDNVSGIYAEPLKSHLREIIARERQWTIVDHTDPILDVEEFVDSPGQVSQVLADRGAEAMILLRITRGPGGTNLVLSLIGRGQAGLIGQTRLTGLNDFQTSDLRRHLSDLYSELRRGLPYRGVILSRRGRDITIDIGLNAGLQVGDELPVVHIIQAHRHPRRGQILSTDKAIIGQIQLTRVENTLSFGSIIMEQELGVVQPGSKILGKEVVHYPRAFIGPDGRPVEGLSDRPEKNIAFGADAKIWRPQQRAQYGKVGLLFGLANFEYRMKLRQDGPIDTTALFPGLHIDGEVWIDPRWFVEGQIRQFFGEIINGLAESEPERLNGNFAQYHLRGGYNIPFSNDRLGPRISLLAGFTQFSTQSESASPLSFTTARYGGISLGVRGAIPLDSVGRNSASAEFSFVLEPSLRESPESSGRSSRNSINSFTIGYDRYLQERLKLRGQLSFDSITTSFSGSGSRDDSAQSSSQRWITLGGGVEFLF